ncbi:MAG: RNA polymerase sigma factor [Emcibacter sp.]|nr:RNA polymerase sigma factor [Emcibacter sp.]
MNINITDEQLMIRIGGGDRTAYKILVDRHLRPYLVFAARVIQDRAGAEDIMQEAFVRVWKNASKWDQGRKTRFTTWFYRIVMNLCIDAKRKYKPAVDLAEAYDVKSDEIQPDAHLSEKQMAAEIATALQHLPDRQRMAMTLCYLQGLGNKEAADILGVTTSAMESLLVRGRKKMAELLSAHKKAFIEETMR